MQSTQVGGRGGGNAVKECQSSVNVLKVYRSLECVSFFIFRIYLTF